MNTSQFIAQGLCCKLHGMKKKIVAEMSIVITSYEDMNLLKPLERLLLLIITIDRIALYHFYSLSILEERRTEPNTHLANTHHTHCREETKAKRGTMPKTEHVKINNAFEILNPSRVHLFNWFSLLENNVAASSMFVTASSIC